MESVLIAVVGALAIIIPALLLHYREIKKDKLKVKELEALLEQKEKTIKQLGRIKNDYEIKETYLDKILGLTSYNAIKEVIDGIFEKTKADRFLILIAINGKEVFNVVSVVFEQHKTKEHKINAIATYRNIQIDNHYRALLKEAENVETVNITVKDLPSCLLKDFYTSENVKYSKIRHLLRQSIDEDNDFLIYSSLATHIDQDFSRVEKAFIKTQYEGTIIPLLKEVLT